MNSNYSEIKIIIAEDHPAYRLGVKNVIKKHESLVVVGEADNGKDLLDLLESVPVDIVLMDIQMPQVDGIEATKKIKILYPNIKIIALSMHKEEEFILEMLDAGVSGYLSKNADSEEIIEGIRSVYNGQVYYCKPTKAVVRDMILKSKYHPHQKVKPEIDEREKQIIKLLCKEYSAKEISEILEMKHRTVEGIKIRLQEKFEVNSTAGIITYAIKNRLIRIDEI